jgi:hypothetical protein
MEGHDPKFDDMYAAAEGNEEVNRKAAAQIIVDDSEGKITYEEALKIVDRNRVSKTEGNPEVLHSKTTIGQSTNGPKKTSWVFEVEEKKEALGEFLREHSQGGNFGVPIPEEKPKP